MVKILPAARRFPLMNMRRFHPVFLLSALLLTSLRADDLRVGMELSYPPFEMTDAQGKPSGISVDIARELAKTLNRNLVVVNCEFDGLIPSLQSRSIDLILSSLSITEERAKAVDFSIPYFAPGVALLVGLHSPVQAADDLLSGKYRVAVKLGTTGHLWARDHLPADKILVFNSADTAALEVGQGKADAFLYDQLSVLHYVQNAPDKCRGLYKPVLVQPWGIAVRKGNTALLQQVNAFLAAFKADSRLNALLSARLGKELAYFSGIGISLIPQ